MHLNRWVGVAVFALAATTSSAQIAASFTVSHAGLAPSAEATVQIGDTVQFIYGSGGPHPMTSGHGLNIESPVFFPTVTVTASVPEAFCTLEEPGTYFFHCGTNPGNSANWGTLEVLDPNGIAETEAPSWQIRWNPIDNVITFEGQELPSEMVLMNAAGAVIQRWVAVSTGFTATLPELPQGLYLLGGAQGAAHKIWIQ